MHAQIACQILERYDDNKPQSRSFETWWYLRRGLAVIFVLRGSQSSQGMAVWL